MALEWALSLAQWPGRPGALEKLSPTDLLSQAPFWVPPLWLQFGCLLTNKVFKACPFSGLTDWLEQWNFRKECLPGRPEMGGGGGGGGNCSRTTHVAPTSKDVPPYPQRVGPRGAFVLGGPVLCLPDLIGPLRGSSLISSPRLCPSSMADHRRLSEFRLHTLAWEGMDLK